LFYSGSGIASCILSESCDVNSYPSKCDSGKAYTCAKKSGLVRITDCEYYGLNCGFSEYYKMNICFGDSKQGEPCPVWFDCDHSSSMDNCVGSLGSYCTKSCTTNADCPNDYTCEILSDGEKACIKNL